MFVASRRWGAVVRWAHQGASCVHACIRAFKDRLAANGCRALPVARDPQTNRPRAHRAYSEEGPDSWPDHMMVLTLGPRSAVCCPRAAVGFV
jgi:hypothetical protein